MNDTLFVIPKKGVNVRREDTGAVIAATGETVPNSSYYRRRINDGDLVQGTAPVKKARKPAKAKAE